MHERVLITGTSGLLGFALATHLIHRNLEILGVSRSQPRTGHIPNVILDLTQFDALTELVQSYRPTVIVHAAALSKVIQCQKTPKEAWLQNHEVTRQLALAANSVRAHLIFISTDQVFDGEYGNYRESAELRPSNIYGQTKRAAEAEITSICERFLIIRSNSIVGRNVGIGLSFTDKILKDLQDGRSVTLFIDQFRSPIHLRECVRTIDGCIRNRLEGHLNLGGPEVQSRYVTGLALAHAYQFSPDLIVPGKMDSHPESYFFHKNGSFDTGKLRSLFPDIANVTVAFGFKKDYLTESKLTDA